MSLVLITAFGSLRAADENTVKESPKVERPISPRLSKEITAGLPKFAPPATSVTTPGSTAIVEEPRNAIIHLPTYIVRDRREPSKEDILTTQGWEEDAVKRYLGPKDNLDRTLNAVTLAELWKSIPLLGRIPFVPFGSVSDGQRAQFLYERVETKRRFMEILDMGTLAPPEKPRSSPPKK